MRRLSCGIVFISGLLFAACASTRVTDSWRSPELQGNLSFNKIGVIVLAKDETSRRVVEDELVAFIGQDRAASTYQLIPLEDLKDIEKAKAGLKTMSVDGLVMIRPVDVRQEVNYVPGSLSTPYYSPWGYSSMTWGYMASPGYMTTDTIVRLETNIYSMPEEKLLWSGASETFNPGDLRTEAKNYAEVVKARLQKEKLIP